MKNLGMLWCLLLIYTSLTAQNKSYFSNDKIEILQNVADCHDDENGIHKQFVFFTLKNKTNEAIRVSYKKQLWYNGTCTTCNSDSKEQQFSIVLNPNETIQGTCDKNNKALSVFSKMLNMKKSELTRFELTDIKITIVK